MKIVVLMKQTFDTETRITLTNSGQIDDSKVNYIVDPYSEFAVEEALRIKERLGTGEVIVLSVGPERVETSIRQCLAMGADRGVLVNDPSLAGGDEFTTALVLAKALEKMEYDLILAGYQAVDDGSAQVGPRVAELLQIPCVTTVTKLELDGTKATATREVDDGFEILELQLPGLFTAQQGLAEPRYPSMKGIMQAKKKPLERLDLAGLGLAPSAVGSQGARVRVNIVTLPAARQAGKVIGGEPQEAVAQLLGSLKDEAKII